MWGEAEELFLHCRGDVETRRRGVEMWGRWGGDVSNCREDAWRERICSPWAIGAQVIVEQVIWTSSCLHLHLPSQDGPLNVARLHISLELDCGKDRLCVPHYLTVWNLELNHRKRFTYVL